MAKIQVVVEAFEKTACSCRKRVLLRVDERANALLADLHRQFINPQNWKDVGEKTSARTIAKS